ncbi:MFS transporter [Mangrovimicrobium sediminis]|uniref:MFS transporter n=2 Tax=Mangrovimicrobium sediminis TaxID=2562682 RepID=A0A4Z0M8T2_9GAMM|nr:MFS transporter [Haliea sp. SAOS-164]
MNTIDKMLIPALAEPLRIEFDLSDSQLGLLIGLVFSVAYAIASIPMGLMIDRLNRTRLLAGLLALWSVLTLVSSRAGSLTSLALCRMGVAAAESGGNPTTLSLLNDYFPRNERARAIGIFSANAAVAGVLVFSLAGLIAAQHGWRAVFVAASVPGFLLSIIVLLSLREPRRGAFDPAPAAAEDATPPGLGTVLRALGSNRTLLWVISAAVLTTMGQAGSSAFVSAFFVRIHELPLEKAGLIAGLILGPGLAIGSVTGGFIADVRGRRSAGGGCYFVGIATGLAVPLGIAAYMAPSVAVSMVCLFGFQVLGTCFYGATMATILELSPLRVRGSIITYSLLLMNLGGYGLGPQISGGFSDLYRHLGVDEPLRWGLASVIGLLLLASACYFIAARRMQGGR